MNKSKLGNCEDCNNVIAPVWYRDKELKEPILSHGTCVSCFKNVIVEQITLSEYRGMKQ